MARLRAAFPMIRFSALLSSALLTSKVRIKVPCFKSYIKYSDTSDTIVYYIILNDNVEITTILAALAKDGYHDKDGSVTGVVRVVIQW